MTKDEKRKFKYLLSKAGITQKALDDRFNNIDRKMKNVVVGSTIYEADVFDGAYPQKVIEIVDREQGIVKVCVEGVRRESTVCILERHLTVEDACKFLW